HGGPHLLGGPREQAALVLALPDGLRILRRGGLGVQQVAHGRVSGAPGLAPPGVEEVAQLVADHREQPAAERPLPGVVVQSRRGRPKKPLQITPRRRNSSTRSASSPSTSASTSSVCWPRAGGSVGPGSAAPAILNGVPTRSTGLPCGSRTETRSPRSAACGWL